MDKFFESWYNENTKEEQCFIISSEHHKHGDVALLKYSYSDNIISLKILHIITRSEDIDHYDNIFQEDILHMEEVFKSDYFAEFITEDDCYMVWFKEIKDIPLYYENPTMVRFLDPNDTDYYDVVSRDEMRMLAGIAYQDVVICGCCGGTFKLENLNEWNKTENLEYEELPWIDIVEAIVGE